MKKLSVECIFCQMAPFSLHQNGVNEAKIWRVIFDADKEEFGDKNLENMQRRKYLPHIKTPIEFTDIVK